MNDDERTELAVLAKSFSDFVTQYGKDEDRKEVARIEDREDRRKWRDEINDKVDGLERKIDPVVQTYNVAGKLLKFTGASGLLAGLAWLWQHLIDKTG